MKKHSVLQNMKRKTRGKRDVMTDPESVVGAWILPKSLHSNPHPGKKMKEIGKPVHAHLKTERCHCLDQPSNMQTN